MKTLKLSAVMLLAAVQALFAQPDSQSARQEKSISVNGTAEMEVVPDEIYVNITLQEYKDPKAANGKAMIADLEKAMRDVMSEMKIDQKDLTLEGSYGYQYQRKKWKDKDFLMSKTYQLKMRDLAHYDELIGRLDDKGISNVYIARTDHSKIDELKKQVRINAVKAAKEKANYLLQAVNEQLGAVLQIRELDANNYYPVYGAMARNTMVGSYDMESAKSYEPVQMQKIKITYTISATFEIK